MKKFLYLTAIITLLTPLCFAEEANNQQSPNVLIAYYSLSGNTKKVAEAIQKETGGTLFQIETVKTYPEDYDQLLEEAKKEIDEEFYPGLRANLSNIDKYDVIFIGSPNWWGSIAPAVGSYLIINNFKDKRVIPFITHGGGGQQNTIKKLTALCKNCKISPNPWIGIKNDTAGIHDWLKKQGLVK